MGKVLFFSGAGLSADSGLGTFRGSGGGLWDKYDINKVCNYNTWRDNYNDVHTFYSLRRVEYAKAQPNETHKVIARLQQEYGVERVKAITQNIDDLLERAGCTDVLHVHGEIKYIYCVTCGKKYKIDGEFNSAPCENCSDEIFKPHVVFFGEQAPYYTPMYQIITSLTSDDMVVVIGTEGSVVPIADIIGSKSHGIKARRMLCNLEPSCYIDESQFDIVLYQNAVYSVPQIYEESKKILEG